MTHESDTPTWSAPRITVLGRAHDANIPPKCADTVESGSFGPSGPV